LLNSENLDKTLKYKVTRDLSRLNFLIKNKDKETEYENLTSQYYKEIMQGTDKPAYQKCGYKWMDARHDEFGIFNVKVAKQMFNRIFRAKLQNPKQAIPEFEELLKACDHMLGEGHLFGTKILG